MHVQFILTLLTTLTTILALPAHSSEPDLNSPALVPRASCDSSACITYFSDSGCTNGRALGSYKPDCTGHCFQYSTFSSIRVQANTVTGADCVAYSDSNCQNEIKDSGNRHDTYCLDNVSDIFFGVFSKMTADEVCLPRCLIVADFGCGLFLVGVGEEYAVLLWLLGVEAGKAANAM